MAIIGLNPGLTQDQIEEVKNAIGRQVAAVSQAMAEQAKEHSAKLKPVTEEAH